MTIETTMAWTTKTITIDSRDYEDHDDCLAAASADYEAHHPEAEGYDLCPRWEDDMERETILLDVPVEIAD